MKPISDQLWALLTEDELNTFQAAHVAGATLIDTPIGTINQRIRRVLHGSSTLTNLEEFIDALDYEIVIRRIEE